MIDTIYKNHHFAHYAELREQEMRYRRLMLVDGVLVRNMQGSTHGFSARTYANGCYGFASGSVTEAEAGMRLVKAAEENAKLLSSKVAIAKPAFTKVAPLDVSYDMDLAITESQEHLIDFLKTLDQLIIKDCPNLAGRTVICDLLDMQKHLRTTDNVSINQIIPRHRVVVILKAKSPSGSTEELYFVESKHGRFKDNFTDPAELMPQIMECYHHLMAKLEGVRAEAGEATVILDPDLGGIVAHEAVGHTVEADLVRAGSVAGPRFGTKVASDLVSMVDFAYEAYGNKLPMPIYVDDEGTPGKDAKLITNGILTGYMHNKESALDFGHEACGNARAFEFYDEPLIRMRNTYILPGTSTLEEMIASVEDGYYLISTGNGQADSTGEFMFGVTTGYEIKNGKLGRAILDTTISGIAFEALQTVSMVGNELKITGSGMCGKKQMIPVSMGGPALKLKLTVGG